MVRRQNLGTYLLIEGPGPKVNAFANPDDCFAFIDAHSDDLIRDAQAGYEQHGRGLVILQGPFGGRFVKASYCTAEPSDSETFGTDAAREDLEEYDPEREALIGVTDPEESFLWFWKCSFDTD